MAELRDESFMRLALAEARKGLGRTSPNPAVGAVIVRDGTVVARGYHKKAGDDHAEVAAIKKAGGAARGATIYVTLEPCNHQGRTGPCTEAILAAGIRRVVVGMADPNPNVAGAGAARLAGAGLAVTTGVLADRCLAINRPFVKHVTTGRPWVTVKAALSLDGKMAAGNGHSNWITGEASRRHVHRMRDRADAIMVGAGTALGDDPSLTARVHGGRDPLRVVLDSSLRLPATARMLSQSSAAATLVFCAAPADQGRKAALAGAGAEVVELAKPPDGGLPLPHILDHLGSRGITSLLVEGGGRLHSSLIAGGLADEACFFYAPILIGNDGLALLDPMGISAVDRAIRINNTRIRRFGDDILVQGFFHKS
ncbi:MAG: bifunctional diaminohydroxyphosphoribosylaminopyrimidine deaminase/5-amino-6-(5-phosphoribosylamino)uracil reductase RibD [Thermodesulfobacteriota bacterium]